jgi:hypothetical protein
MPRLTDPSRARGWVRLAVFLFLALAVARTVADVDLWGHVLFGRDIVNQREIPVTDTYSFTSDRAWINHEWLAESIMYLSYRMMGPAGLVTLRLLTIVMIGVLVGASIGTEHFSQAGRDSLIMLGVILTLPRTQHVRPQLFSVVLFGVLLLILTRADRGNRRALWLVPPLMAAWANLHGGWMVGLGAFGLWSACEFIRDARWAARAQTVMILALSVLATLVNPYGWGLWRFVWTTVGVGRADIEEWSPITKVSPGLLALWLTAVLLAVWTAKRAGQARRWNYLFLVAVLGLLSFRVSRLDAFFGLAVVMLLQPRLLRGAHARVSTAPTDRGIIRSAALPVLVAILTPMILWVARRPISCIEMDRLNWLPEGAAVEFARTNQLRGRMLTFFDWGEYAIWHLSPAVQVSIDGRRETVYSPSQIDRHMRIYSDLATDAEIRNLDVDYVWLPRNLQVVNRFSRHNWVPIYDGRLSVILARNPGVEFEQVPAAPEHARCFPGP